MVCKCGGSVCIPSPVPGAVCVLLPLAGMLKYLELPFLSFRLYSAFLCAGLKRNSQVTGRLLQLLTQLYVQSPGGMLNKGLFHALPALDILSYLCILL